LTKQTTSKSQGGGGTPPSTLLQAPMKPTGPVNRPVALQYKHIITNLLCEELIKYRFCACHVFGYKFQNSHRYRICNCWPTNNTSHMRWYIYGLYLSTKVLTPRSSIPLVIAIRPSDMKIFRMADTLRLQLNKNNAITKLHTFPVFAIQYHFDIPK
jgi:hypothetical protein